MRLLTSHRGFAVLVWMCSLSAACSEDASEPASNAGDGASGESGASGEGGTSGASGEGATSGEGGTSGVGDSGGTGGDEPPAGGASGQGGNEALPMLEADTPWEDVPDACKGFELRGLTESPGGDVLPNTCAPFDGTFNNPYAIRCIDADPTFDSGYPGDEWCILPPPAALGTQVRVGPESYDDVDASFLMEPGDEINDWYYLNAANEEEHFYYRTNWRMRSGSHHMIINLMEEREDGWSPTGDTGVGANDDGEGGLRAFGGAQRPDLDRPQGTLAVPPENQGLGGRLRAHDQFSFNLHHFNMTQGTTLREAWVNVWYKPDSEVTDEMLGITLFGNPADVSVPAGEHKELHYVCDVTGNTRVITFSGHRHMNTDRFGVWLERGGEDIPLYESFYYTDMPTFQYDSVSMNPPPDLASRTDGGFTGMLDLVPGDKVHFVCDIQNQLDQPLKFANEVKTGEMCILFGTRTGDSLCRGFLQNMPR